MRETNKNEYEYNTIPYYSGNYTTKEYINNISNTNNFYSIVEKKLGTLKKSINKKIPKRST